MRSVSAHEVTPAVTALFDLSKPTMPRAFNVLEGSVRGQIVVDELAHPTWAIVRDTIYGTLYLGGQFDAALLATIINYFRSQGAVGIGCWPDDPVNDILPTNPDYDGVTLYFTQRSPRDLAPMFQLSSGYVLVPRDEHWFKQSSDYVATLALLGTVENALRLTYGVVVVLDNTIACEAGTGVATHGRIEVGVTTANAHRQLGLATAACAKLIEICEAHGYTTWWDCAKQNTASVRLARKLGYENEREYRYRWWAPRKPA